LHGTLDTSKKVVKLVKKERSKRAIFSSNELSYEKQAAAENLEISFSSSLSEQSEPTNRKHKRKNKLI
jgi:hypothetical protein